MVVGLVIRLRIAETPAFARVMEKRETAKSPLADAFRLHPKEMLLGAGVITVVYVMSYTAATYCMTYTTGTLGIPKNDMLALTLVVVVVLGVSTFLVEVVRPGGAAEADHRGRGLRRGVGRRPLSRSSTPATTC
ncbi:hypothetical protein ACFV3T_12490 [Streptomyces albidoflavus]